MRAMRKFKVAQPSTEGSFVSNKKHFNENISIKNSDFSKMHYLTPLHLTPQQSPLNSLPSSLTYHPYPLYHILYPLPTTPYPLLPGILT